MRNKCWTAHRKLERKSCTEVKEPTANGGGNKLDIGETH